MTEWFSFSTLSNLASQASKLADELADTLAAQAAAVQTEFETEHLKVKQEQAAQAKLTIDSDSLLPWETSDESKMILSQDLMERILELSLCERNFTSVPPNIHAIDFNFSSVVPTIMKLLQIDANLARMQAKLSLKINEETFWHNYFFRVYYLRAVVGMDDATPFQFDIYPVADIIHKSSLPLVHVDNPIDGEGCSSVGSSTGGSSTRPATEGSDSTRNSNGSPSINENNRNIITQTVTSTSASTLKQQQQIEKERQLEQRKLAEAKLAAAVEAELSDSNADEYVLSSDNSKRYKAAHIGVTSVGGVGNDANNQGEIDFAAEALDLDLDLDMDLGDDIDLDDLGDLEDLDLNDDEDDHNDAGGIRVKEGNIDTGLSSFDDLAGTSVGGSGSAGSS